MTAPQYEKGILNISDHDPPQEYLLNEREKAISMKDACDGVKASGGYLNRFQADVLSHRPQGRKEIFLYKSYLRCQVKYIRF